MTYVVTEACIRCKYMDCVTVCPVNAFHEGDSMLVIDPEKCIDCGICESECPVGAISPDTIVSISNRVEKSELKKDEPKSIEFWVEFNKKCSKKWKNITTQGLPPHDADQWRGVENKLAFIQEELFAQNILSDSNDLTLKNLNLKKENSNV